MKLLPLRAGQGALATLLASSLLAGPSTGAGDVLYTVETNEVVPSAYAELAFGVWTLPLDDVDGDGARDFAVGEPGAREFAVGGSGIPGWRTRWGRVRIVSGATGATLRTIRGGPLQGSVGFQLFDAGDLDGDGLRDLATSAGLPQLGAGIAFFSSASGALLARVAVRGSFGFPPPTAVVGDVDGDGTPDVLVGDPERTIHYGGATTFFPYGNGLAELVSGADGSLLRSIRPDTGFGVGAMVAALGDLDGDAVPDYGVLGSSKTGAADFHLISGTSGDRIRSFRMVGYEQRSSQIARVGDLDGDGSGDLVFAGRWSLRAFSTSPWSEHFEVPLANFGIIRPAFPAVASIGDVDGDGRDDLAVVVTRAYAFFGSSGKAGVLHVLSGATGAELSTFPLDAPPYSVGGLGDVDGDGVPEVLVGYAGRVEVRSVLERLTEPVTYCDWIDGGLQNRLLTTSGSTSLSTGQLTFDVQSFYSGSSVRPLLLIAPERDLLIGVGAFIPHSSSGMPLCLAGPLRRVASGRLDAQGHWQTTPDLSWLAAHGVIPGSTWSFQTVFLNGTGHVLSSTNAVRVPFAP